MQGQYVLPYFLAYIVHCEYTIFFRGKRFQGVFSKPYLLEDDPMVFWKDHANTILYKIDEVPIADAKTLFGLVCDINI